MRLGLGLMCAVAALALAGCKKEQPRDPMSGLDQKSREILEKANIQVDAERLSQTCLRPGDANRPISSFSQAERLELIACANREVVRVMTPRLPLRVDALTSLTSVVASGPMLTYNARVDIDASQLSRGPDRAASPGHPDQCLRPAADAPDDRDGRRLYLRLGRPQRPQPAAAPHRFLLRRRGAGSRRPVSILPSGSACRCCARPRGRPGRRARRRPRCRWCARRACRCRGRPGRRRRRR